MEAALGSGGCDLIGIGRPWCGELALGQQLLDASREGAGAGEYEAPKYEEPPFEGFSTSWCVFGDAYVLLLCVRAAWGYFR